MHFTDGMIRLSASDLMRFKGCAHATTLDLRYAERRDIVPAGESADAELLQKQGDDHELAFLNSLKVEGSSLIEIAKDGLRLEEAVLATNEALARGPDVIFQGALLGGSWGGYSDFLERVDMPSDLGSFSYEVVDTKLKRRPDPKHLLQLSLYSDLLTAVQGVAPKRAHLQLGNGERFSIRLADVSAYARHARRRLELFIEERPETKPEPVSSCGLCRWREHCRSEWQATGSLALVAGMTRSQRSKVEDAGLTTMAELADHKGRIPRLSAETQTKLQLQARLQAARSAGGAPQFALRDEQPGKGFALLPPPDEGDIFYDIEGDPYYEGGLEYLHGVWFREGGGWAFRAFWAHDRVAEGRAAAELLDFIVERLRAYPKAHVYHYAQYEMTALRHLTAAHRTGEAALDQLQRERRFVDLFKVVAGGMVASEEGYSIKDLEAFYMPKRDGQVATAGASVVYYERWRETGDDQLLELIHDYNRTDCVSTQLLRDWLIEKVRSAGMPWRELGQEPEQGSLENVASEEMELAELRRRLEPVRLRLGDEVAELLLDLNHFHRREDKPSWWAIFDRLCGEDEELLDDLECVAALEAIGPPVAVTRQSFERTYRFPAQETKLRAGKRPCIKPSDMPEDVDLRSLDRSSGTLVLRRSAKKGPLPDRLHLIPPKPIANKALRDAVVAATELVIQQPGQLQALEHLLARTPPALTHSIGSSIVDQRADLPSEASRAVRAMRDTVLPIQGPPGTGKTYVSALTIVDLVREGKRVAVSSNSHKAIINLLEAVADRAKAQGVVCRIARKGSEEEDEQAHPGIKVVSDNDAPEIAQAHVVGATAWHFARYPVPAFEHLFVDEAGQVSFANIVAMARCARNIVLVGDPMQLPQPIQGSHPGRSGESCLEYLIDGHRVVPPERGIFMPTSRRMHSSVCSYVSMAVYDGQLSSDASADRQALITSAGAGLRGARLVSVGHEGRSQVCPEEIEALRLRIAELVGATFTARDGTSRVIGHADILVVAPYNAQVNALREALPRGVRVGTVDRFQGQEAPICLVSMTTSSAEELPRDIEFLFSLNRINVAVSRAQILAEVFASPKLLEVPCRTVREMTLVNALCVLHEYGDGASAAGEAPA